MIYAVIASLCCFLLACFGASIIFFIKKDNRKIDIFLHAFSSGIMLASAIFSLIIPALDYCNELGFCGFIVLPLCFLLVGILFIWLEKLNNGADERVNTKMLSFGVFLHNIPEGFCLGFAFASYSVLGTHEALISAIMIAIGIGIQNIPEGSTVAFPLYLSGKNKKQSFWGAISVALVEIPSCIVAFLIGNALTFVLPFMLAFAGATMIVVASTELMPMAVKMSEKWSVLWLVLGMVFMMWLVLFLG